MRRAEYSQFFLPACVSNSQFLCVEVYRFRIFDSHVWRDEDFHLWFTYIRGEAYIHMYCTYCTYPTPWFSCDVYRHMQIACHWFALYFLHTRIPICVESCTSSMWIPSYSFTYVEGCTILYILYTYIDFHSFIQQHLWRVVGSLISCWGILWQFPF